MTTALIRNYLYDDNTVYGNPRTTTNVITIGDFIIASGSAVVGGESSLGGDMLRASGLGIALANNPSYNELGVAVVNTALPIATRGVFRVSAISGSAAGGLWPIGQPVYPATTGSGIVGQTGLTGIGPIWATAAVVADTTAWSAARAFFSGVGKVVKVHSVGIEGAGQMDIELFPQGAHGYI
jgi:hypothetical protein